MGKPLSADLWPRLVAAVAGGPSRRATAEHFRVSAVSSVHWVRAYNTTGTVRAMPQGATCTPITNGGPVAVNRTSDPP